MTGPEHYRLAEELAARSGEVDGKTREQILTRAQIHATLALVAAQAESFAWDTSDHGDYIHLEWAGALS